MKAITHLIKPMIIVIVLTGLLTFSTTDADGQEKVDVPSYSSIGLAPLFYKGLNYKEKEYDVNIIPFMIDGKVAKYSWLGIRLMTHLHLQVRPEEKHRIGLTGFEISLPVYYYQVESKSFLVHRLYVAPGIQLLLDAKLSEYDLDFNFNYYIEPGYTIYLNEEIGFTAGIQFGQIRQNSPLRPSATKNFISFRLAYLRSL